MIKIEILLFRLSQNYFWQFLTLCIPRLTVVGCKWRGKIEPPMQTFKHLSFA